MAGLLELLAQRLPFQRTDRMLRRFTMQPVQCLLLASRRLMLDLGICRSRLGSLKPFPKIVKPGRNNASRRLTHVAQDVGGVIGDLRELLLCPAGGKIAD